MIDSDNDEMDVDANTSKSNKGMIGMILTVDVINGLPIRRLS